MFFASNACHDLKLLNRDTDRDAALLRLGLWNGVPWTAAWNSPSFNARSCRWPKGSLCLQWLPETSRVSSNFITFMNVVQTEKWNFSTSQTSRGTGIEENISGSLYCLLAGWDCRQDTRRAWQSWRMFGCSTWQESREEGWCQEVWTGCPEVARI